MSKKKLSFSFHWLLSFSPCISHNFLLLSLFFSSFTCSHSHSLQDCTVLNVGTSNFSFLYHKWPNGLFILFLSPFLLFLLPHSSHHITINASHLLWLCFNQNLFLQLSLAEWPCWFLFFFLRRVQHTLAHFSLREVRLLTSHGVICPLNKLLKKYVG